MIYIFIDTNNLKYCSLQTKENNNPETLKDLKEILSNDENVKLIVPEVIKLEYYRVVEESFVEKIKNELGKLKKYMNMRDKLNFPEHLKEPIKEKLKEIKLERQESKKTALSIFREIVELENTKIIPLTSEIIVNSEKRRIQRSVPSDGSVKKNQDCYIIDSLVSYLNNLVIDESARLLFCSNDTDFLEKNNGEYDGVHEDIKNELNIDVNYYRLLPDMISEEFDKEISDEERKNIEKLDKVAKINDILYDLSYPNEELQEAFKELNEKNQKVKEALAEISLKNKNWDSSELSMINNNIKKAMNLKSKELKETFNSIYMDNQELENSLKILSHALYSDNDENEN